MTPDLPLETQLDLALRLTVGLVLGAIIGFERELSRQPAGFRTHSLVSLGAALFTVVSAFGFSGSAVDPTRIAAQIVSGIGFIGAGTILQYRGHIRGLYVVAVVGTVLILVILAMLDRVEAFARRRLRLPPDHYDLPKYEPDDGMSEDLP
jgi:uncharacterized membrane protein YhiD involved in acid resistance